MTLSLEPQQDWSQKGTNEAGGAGAGVGLELGAK